MLSGLTPLRPDVPLPGGKPRKIRFYRPPTVPVSQEANAARVLLSKKSADPVLDEHSTTQIMGGEKGNLVISDIVGAIRGRTGIDVYLLDTFNFSQVKQKREI